MIQLLKLDNSNEPIWITGRYFSIGRGNANMLVISETTAELKHASIRQLGQHYFLKDLNTEIGTFVNEKKCPLTVFQSP